MENKCIKIIKLTSNENWQELKFQMRVIMNAVLQGLKPIFDTCFEYWFKTVKTKTETGIGKNSNRYPKPEIFFRFQALCSRHI